MGNSIGTFGGGYVRSGGVTVENEPIVKSDGAGDIMEWQPSDGGADGIDSRMVALDMDHPRVTGVGGERLFDQGKRSSYLEEIAGLLEALYEGAVHVEQFIDALETHQQIENVTLEVKLNNGSTNQLLGYAALNEDRIQSLSGDELAALNNAGFLMPMFMVLASIAQMRGLIDRKNDKVQRAQDVPAF